VLVNRVKGLVAASADDVVVQVGFDVGGGVPGIVRLSLTVNIEIDLLEHVREESSAI
jgi:hypothetical protein